MSKKKKTMNRDTKRVRKLSDQMKKGELYVVLTYYSLEDGSMYMLGYSDTNHTPRIYERRVIDAHIPSTVPICRLFRTAVRRVQGKANAVLLPLSEMIDIFGERKVKTWAKAQREISPQEVRDYVKRRTHAAAQAA